MISTGNILEIVNLMTDLGFMAFVGVGVVIGGAGWLYSKAVKGGR